MSKVQHVSTVTVDPATGQPTYHQDIQGGPATTSAYDSVGRVLTMRTAGTQPVEQRLSACTASANCLVRRQSFQAGAPIKTEYMDLLGRVVATGAEGFDGLEIVTKVAYNEPGLKVAEYAPWKSSVLPGQWDGSSRSPFVTQYSRIDALARVGVKSVLRSSAGLFETGRGDSTLTTTYTYVPVDIGLWTDPLEELRAARAVGWVEWARHSSLSTRASTPWHESGPRPWCAPPRVSSRAAEARRH